jgi:hypothetical protein
MDITNAGQETIKWPLICDELYTVWVPWLVYLTNVEYMFMTPTDITPLWKYGCGQISASAKF